MPKTTPEIISLYSSGVQAFATIVLVIITWKQMAQAQKSVESMERSIKADFLPIIMLGIRPSGSSGKTLNISLLNCGKGVAIKPKVIFPGQADIVINSINEKESDNVTINYNKEFILKKIEDRDRKIIIEYKDVYGRKIITEANLVELDRLGPLGNENGIGWESWTPIIP